MSPEATPLARGAWGQRKSSEREGSPHPTALLNASGGRVSAGSSQFWQVVFHLAEAIADFKKCVATGVTNFTEYQCATAELKNLRG